MRLTILRLLLITICIALYLEGHAQTQTQTCNGSLGDPVINQTFGQGANPGAQIGGTNMTYTTNNCPDDGFYTISNSLIPPGNCHPTWHDVAHDHTGNPNGYMMIINASFQPSVFFTQAANGLCPNTTYEFSAYILNLLRLAASDETTIQPNLVFSIETKAGQVLVTAPTGIIAATDLVNWIKFPIYFTTPKDVTDVVVKISNLAPGGNGNDLILDDITFRACGPIIQSGFASINGPNSQDLCQGGSADYTIKTNVVGNNDPVYQWQSNNGSGWNDIGGETTSTLNISFKNAVPGTYQYRLGVANGSDINSVQCRVYSPPLTINVNPLPVVPAFATQTFCIGNTMTLTASGGSTYVWSGPNLPPTSQNPLVIENVTPADAGTYTVTPTSDKGCPGAPVQAIVKIVPKVVPVVSADPLPICAGSSIRLSASGGLYYKWSPSDGLDYDNIATPVASPAKTTTYKVTISNDGCTDTTKSVTVTVDQNPVATAGSNKFIFEGQSVKLDGAVLGDEITSVYWSPSNDLDDPTSPTPIASPVHDVTYTLTVTSQRCGISTGSVFVRVYEKITIPNTFTPNGDGINDLWNIKKLITYPECNLNIYTRDGQQVFQSNGYAKPWDGTQNGKQLPQGTYYYILDLKNNTPKRSGWVLLLR